MLRLKTEIKLAQQHPPTLLGNSHPVTPSPPLGMALQHCRHLLHHLQIEAEQTLEPRALDFEHHLASAAKAGAMHLRE